MNVSLLSNLIAAAIMLVGYLLPSPFRGLALDTGLFALSGGLTNWLAIHMLFERVPFMYGSGVILNRFESFKTTLHDLMMKEFFNDDHLRSFLTHKTNTLSLDLDTIFNHLADAIADSSFGTMLSLMGGKKALEPLREPLKEKMQDIVDDVIQNQTDPDRPEGLKATISHLIDERLNQLTPTMVRDIMKNMINEHLGWLVIWGTVAGGLIGLIANILGNTWG